MEGRPPRGEMLRRPLALCAFFQIAGILFIYKAGDGHGPAFMTAAGAAAAALLYRLSSYLMPFIYTGHGGGPAPAGDPAEGGPGCGTDCPAGLAAAKAPVLAAAFFLAGALTMTYSMCSTPVPVPGGTEITGVVTDAGEYSGGGVRLKVRADDGTVILVSCYGGTCDTEDPAGRRISVKGTLELPAGAGNPGCFDRRLYLRGQKVTAVMTAGSLETGDVERPLLNGIHRIRDRFRDSLAAGMKEENLAFINAMLFGDKAMLDEDEYEAFQKNGTAHVLAVSGLHIGMIYSLLSMIAGAVGLKRRGYPNLVIFLLLTGYAVMAGCSPSVVRALTMIALHVISKLIHRRYDMLSAACFTSSVMLFYEPYMLFSTGFQMSFLAILVIAFLFPLIEDIKAPAAVKGQLLPVIMIQAGMAPYSMYMFNYFSAASFIANVPVVFLAGITVPMGVIAMPFSLLIPRSAGLFASALDVSCGLMRTVNDIFYAGGAASFTVVSPPLTLLTVFYAALFAFSSEWVRIRIIRKDRTALGSVLLIMVLCLVIFNGAFRNGFREADCVFVDVGQGSCVHLRTPSGKNILIDGGGRPVFGSGKEAEKYDFDVGEKIVMPYLLKNGTGKVDLAMVTHPDADHFKGIVSLCRLGMVEKLGIHENLGEEAEDIMKETGMAGEDIIIFRTGDELKEEGFALRVMGPVEEGGSENGDSMVSRAVYDGFSVLVTGDIDEGAEASLCRVYGGGGGLASDVVSVPHHGSAYSSTEDFIRACSPKAAVIQVGKNNYGHPSQEAVGRYEDAGCEVFRNDERGAVGIAGGRIICMRRQ